MGLKLQIGLSLLALSAFAAAQDDLPRVDFRDRPYWYVGGFLGQSGIILGGEDIRQGGGFSVAYARPERRFNYGKFKGQIVAEVYANRTHSVNEPTSPNTSAAGFLVMSRWHSRQNEKGQGFFMDLGWGFQYASKRSIDLDSRVNSTPVVDLGTTFPLGEKQEFMVALRILHESNAGLAGRNQGSNNFWLTFGVRF